MDKPIIRSQTLECIEFTLPPPNDINQKQFIPIAVHKDIDWDELRTAYQLHMIMEVLQKERERSKLKQEDNWLNEMLDSYFGFDNASNDSNMLVDTNLQGTTDGHTRGIEGTT